MKSNRPTFSLRILLAIVTAACLVAASLAAPPSWPIGLLMLIEVALFPAALTLGLLTDRGGLRAFSAGAIFPAGSTCIIVYVSYLIRWTSGETVMDVIRRAENLCEGRANVASGWLLALVVGLIMIACRLLGCFRSGDRSPE